MGTRVLTNRATGGRKLASGHEYPMCQDVASGHPKGRSAAKEPRRGLTRGSVLTPSPTSCGSSHPLFAIYARIYTAANTLSMYEAFQYTIAAMTRFRAPRHLIGRRRTRVPCLRRHRALRATVDLGAYPRRHRRGEKTRSKNPDALHSIPRRFRPCRNSSKPVCRPLERQNSSGLAGQRLTDSLALCTTGPLRP